jgi:hypothetical protein
MFPYRGAAIVATAAFVVDIGSAVLAQDIGDETGSEVEGFSDPLAQRELHGWRFEFANDAFVDSDSQFTNGISFQKHSSVSGSLDDLQGVRAFGKRLARKLLPREGDLFYRKALSVGQTMGTPTAKDDPNIILDDTPYMGFLGASSSWIGFNNTQFTGFAITAGIVGEYALAEYVQKGVHALTGATDPQGWEHQLDNEPVLNLYFSKKRKFWNTPGFDATLSGDVAVGNFMTSVSSGIEMRIGRKPGGFAYVSDPLGGGPIYDATLPRRDDRADLYMTLVARAWAWATYMPLAGNTFVDGNEWTENNTIEPEHVIAQGIVGIHYVRPSWGMHITWTINSDTVDPDSLAPDADDNDDFGAVTFEWRF